MKKGISIIVLVITIIITILLAGAIIYSTLSEGGIFSRATEAEFKSDLTLFNEELEIYKANHISELKNEGINKQGYDEIKTVISSFEKKYSNTLKIVASELVFTDSENIIESDWAKQVGIKILNDTVPVNFQIEGLGTIQASRVYGSMDTSKQNKCELTESITLKATFGSKTIGDSTINYAFDGWYKNGELISKNATYIETITEPATYTAKFIPNNCTIIHYIDENNNSKLEISNNSKLTGYSSRTDITNIEIGNNVTAIDNNAFNGCTNLQLTSLPSNLTSIGKSAFANCSKIAISEIPNGCYLAPSAFYGCTGITHISIPNSTIDGSATGVQFQACTGLTELTIGSLEHPVTNNLQGLLFQCSQENLTIKLYINHGTTTLAGEPWCATNSTIEYYDASNGNLVNVIMGLKYKGNTQIDWTELPNSSKITKIKDNAFKGCTNLQLTSLPPNLTSIGRNAFENCKKIKISEIPSGCFLGTWAFHECTGITELNIPNSTYDSYYTGCQLQGCTGLTNLTLGSYNHPITNNLQGLLFQCPQDNFNIKVYIDSNTSNADAAKAIGVPWCATKATIVYYASDSETDKIKTE